MMDIPKAARIVLDFFLDRDPEREQRSATARERNRQRIQKAHQRIQEAAAQYGWRRESFWYVYYHVQNPAGDFVRIVARTDPIAILYGEVNIRINGRRNPICIDHIAGKQRVNTAVEWFRIYATLSFRYYFDDHDRSLIRLSEDLSEGWQFTPDGLTPPGRTWSTRDAIDLRSQVRSPTRYQEVDLSELPEKMKVATDPYPGIDQSQWEKICPRCGGPVDWIFSNMDFHGGKNWACFEARCLNNCWAYRWAGRDIGLTNHKVNVPTSWPN